MFGQILRLRFTTGRRYFIPPSRNGLEVINLPLIKDRQLLKTAKNLHCQSGHARNEKIIRLIKYAGTDDKKLTNEVKEVKKCYTTCRHYEKSKQRSAAGFTV